MEIHEMKNARTIIQSIVDDGFKINNTLYNESLLLNDFEIIPWSVNKTMLLEIKQLHKVIEFKPQLFILGHIDFSKKPEIIIHAQQWQSQLLYLNITSEVMSLKSAFNTWNILLAEGRKVMMGIII